MKNDPNETEIERELLTPGTIGGIAVGIVVVLIIIAIISRCCIIWKKRKNGGRYNPKKREEKAGVFDRQQVIPGQAYIPEPERLI